jgi:uncharacterized protein with HEPN domain
MKRPEDEILLRDMVDHDIVWTVVTSDLPSLVREIGRVGD